MAKMNLYTFTTGLLSIWLCAACAYANEEGDAAGDEAEEDAHPFTTAESFHISVDHIESLTSSIEIKWEVPKGYHVNSYVVESKKVDGDAITRSRSLEETTYVIEDLRVSQTYKVCVEAHMEDGSEERECNEYKTINRIRDDSLIALFCALGYIALCALIGYLVWKYHVRQLQAEAGDEEEPINPKEEE